VAYTQDPSSSQPDRESRLNEVYLTIISRYKDYIEEQEGLSVAELPILVTPLAPRIKEKTIQIKSTFLNYDYETNFMEAANSVYKFIKEEINDVALPLQFWLTPEETLTFMLGDPMDKNILMCSLLVSLGNPSAKVLVRINEGTRKVFTYYEFKGALHIFDMEEGMKEFPNKEELLASLAIGDDTVAYEFNNQMYADLY
jgi:hypothetical protein